MAMDPETTIEIWFNPKDTPDVMNPSGNGFSIDVLIYCERTGEHTVGWFDYDKHRWSFLANEPVRDFVWRYLDQTTDRPHPVRELVETNESF